MLVLRCQLLEAVLHDLAGQHPAMHTDLVSTTVNICTAVHRER
jgi:hypothetical protein